MARVNDTKQNMMSAALELFHKQGVNATSIDQILARSETGKSQFTYYFKNKDGLIRATLHFLTDVIKSGQAPTGYEINSWQDMEKWFQNYIEFQKSVEFELSCPIGTIANDLNSEQEILRQDVRLFLEWSRGKIARFFAERKAAGEFEGKVNPDSLADFCISVMQGGMLLTKMKRDSDMFENAAKEALQYLRMLRKKK
jgi:TetR/AcrR family transcriptional regulator, transcriptional repressor for nem operon